MGVAGLPVRLLVQDGVDADRGLAGLAVADDELTLSAADGGHGVDGLDAGGEGLLDGLALEHRGGLQLQDALLIGLDVALSVDRSAEGVDHTTEESVAHGHGEHVAGTADLLAFFQGLVVTQDDGADLVLVEVQRDAEDAAGELEELVGHCAGQSADVSDTVRRIGDGADLVTRRFGFERRDVLLDRFLNLVW